LKKDEAKMIGSTLKIELMVLLASVLPFLLTACSAKPPLRPLSPASSIPSGNKRPFNHDHQSFNHLLEKFVSNGRIDYRELKAEPDLLYSYTASLAAVDRTTVEKWTLDRQKAFWINAYNALTIQAIVERYPIRSRSLIGIFAPRNSILQISGIWNRLTFNAGGRILTLGEIEHEILRKDFDDPRIHFAIVCASISCPDLRAQAYRYDILESQLHDQAVQFINDPNRGTRFDADKKRLYVSRIFKWFRADFKNREATGNPVLAYIRPYLRDDAIAAALAEDQDIRLSYLPYNWRLNEQVHTSRFSAEAEDNDG
jgi:hypothetical protein